LRKQKILPSWEVGVSKERKNKMAYQFASPVKPRPATAVSQPSPVMPKKQPSTQNSSWLRGLLTLIVVIIIVAGGIYLIGGYTGISLPGMNSLNLQNEWQAVFLTNGQVYFGQVAKINSDWVILRNIYYLQVVNQPLQRSQEGAVADTQAEQRLTLIKLGKEVHGPRDEMAISRRQVILIEDLRNDGNVVKAIEDYVKKAGQPAQPAATPEAQQPTQPLDQPPVPAAQP